MHVIPGLPTGGAEMILLRLLSANNGAWEPAVVSLKDRGTIGPRIAELGIPVYSLEMRRRTPNPLRAFSLVSVTRQFRPHLIQGWLYHGNLLASLAGVSSPDLVPVFWNVRMSLPATTAVPWMTAGAIRLGALVSRHPAAIIYNSQNSAQQHEAVGYCALKRVVIPNGFDCHTFRPNEEARLQVRAELGISKDSMLVGLIARYHPMKDHACFLRAAGSVARTHPEANFLLAGSGVTTGEPALRVLVEEQRIQARTHFLGERSDIPRLTAALDIACSSSWVEGFSNSIGEAMACGVPCVVTDVGDSVYIIADTGLSVAPRDPEGMAKAISELIGAGAAHRRSLGSAARRRIESRFSLAAMVRRYEELYQAKLECCR